MLRSASRLLLIGSACSRRTALLREALQPAGVTLEILKWRDLLQSEESCQQRLQAISAGPVWCKIDSPGEDTRVTDALIARGWRLSGSERPAPHPLRHGELAFQHWWFAGLADLMTRIAPRLGSMRLLNPIGEILLMCDKWACQQHLRSRGIDVPELLGEVRSFGELDERLPGRLYPAVFIKARYGSSAAGVVALRRHPDGRVAAYSSARMDGERTIYNHLSISRYTDRAVIAPLVDALAVQGAYAEQWILKPRVPADPLSCYDLRVIACCGKARQRVARISRSPMTNLHLGNRRAPPSWLSAGELAVMEETVERGAAAFPGSHCIGFDVALHGGRAHVLEANAFGDLLPGLRFPHPEAGTTTYEDQARLVSAHEC